MQHRVVDDLMTRDVVRVHRDAGFKEVATLLAEYDVTALPVVDDDGHPVGVVSEADILASQAQQPDPGGLLTAARLQPLQEPRPGAGRSAGELMTSPAVAARPEWTVVEAAWVMERHGVKRLPVVDERDLLVGVLSRSDLVRVFLRRDSAIAEEISDDVLDRTFRFAPDQIAVTVTDGRVRLRGGVERPDVIPIVERLCWSVDGVVDVQNDLVPTAEQSESAASR